MALGSSKLAATTGPPLPPCDAVRDRRTTSAPRAVRAFVAHRPTKPVAPVTRTRTARSSFIPMRAPANILHAPTAFVTEKTARRRNGSAVYSLNIATQGQQIGLGQLDVCCLTSARLSRIGSPGSDCPRLN